MDQIAGFLFILGLIAWFFAPDSWTNSVWYAAKYSVDIRQVHTSDKPTDCDWTRAPLGSKGCHYKLTATAYNAEGFPVRGDGAPKYGHDTKTGKPIISWDNGNTWDWLPASATPDLAIKTVEVGWDKVTE